MRNSIVLLLVILLEVIGNMCLSHGMRSFGSVTWAMDVWTMAFKILSQPWIVVGIVILLCYFLFFLTALSRMDLSYVLPMTACSYILTSVTAALFLREKVSALQWAGTFFICFGVLFVNQSEQRTRMKEVHS